MTRREQFILAFFASSIVFGCAVLFLSSGNSDGEIYSIENPAEQGRSSVVVAIEGAVVAPGVYDFSEGDRVEDAILRAGGLTEDSDISLFNRAARLMDGSTLTIVRKGETEIYNLSVYLRDKPGFEKGKTSVRDPDRINLNSASQVMLETLPGVGATYASAIIEYRESHLFQSIEELKKVSGFGPKRYEALKDLITVQ